MFLWMNVFTLCIRLACDSQRHERLQRIRYWFTSNHIPFRFGCRPREASRLEAKTHEAEAKTHEAEATTHEAEARFFGLEAEARPRGLTSLVSVACRPAEKRRRRGEIGSIHRSILVGHRRPTGLKGLYIPVDTRSCQKMMSHHHHHHHLFLKCLFVSR